MTNNQIAQQLVVSVRTIESHLYHAFDKLGVTHRDELTASLTQSPAEQNAEHAG